MKSLAQLVLLAGCAAVPHPAAADCTLEAVAIIPTIRFEGHDILAADINGRRANLIADTGASTTNIETASAQRLGLTLSLRSRDNQGIGGSEHAYRAFASKFRVSQLNLDGQFLGGTDAARDPQIDGLLGMDVLAPYDIDFDAIGQHIILFEKSRSCRGVAVAIARPLYSAPLAYMRDDALAEVDVLVDGKRVRALIDSGSPSSVLFRKAARLLNLDLAAFDSPGHHESRGVGPSKVKSFSHLFPSIGIGDFTLENMPIEVLDQPGFAINRLHIGSLLPDDDDGLPGAEQMILGADFLQKVHVWISHSWHRLVMQYPPRASALPQ